jgi:tRNA threonylcarbamoyl adenosine modification protein (Sua5/YciO/YrdC/YwlC family)
MLVKLYQDNPNKKELLKIVDILNKDGVIIFPTDSVYAMGCSLNSQKAMNKIAKLKGVKSDKAKFSIICDSLGNIAKYAKVSNPIFKLMKRNLPGSFTFILPGSSDLPKLFSSKRKTIGIRIPDHYIPTDIAKELGFPLLTTSLKEDSDVVEYLTDPELIYEKYKKQVDLVIDGGYGNNTASTIVECTDDEYEILRQGIAELEE